MRTTQSDLDRVQRIGSRARDRQPIRGVSDVSDDTACKGVQALAPLAPGRRHGTRRSPLSEYMSLHLSLKLTTNCVPLSRIKWEIYFYIYVFLVVHKDTAEYTTIIPYQMLPLRAVWTWERWQWRGALHTPKLQHYWSLAIRFFSVIFRILVGGVLPLFRDAISLFYSLTRLGKWIPRPYSKP